MSRDDQLRQAARAMRQEVRGENNGSGFTRARIMRTLQKRRKRTGVAWILVPSLGIALGGTAWASATGKLPVLVERVAVLLSMPQHEVTASKGRDVPPPVVSRRQSSRTLLEDTPVPQVQEVEAPLEPVLEVTPTPSSVAATPPRVEHGSVVARLPIPKQIPLDVAPAPDPELRAFRSAHGTHFGGGSAAAALSAYRDYLAAYPSGRFVPEARYNIALNLVRLGRFHDAKAALEPFADGAFGEYRRQEARELLDALSAKVAEQHVMQP